MIEWKVFEGMNCKEVLGRLAGSWELTLNDSLIEEMVSQDTINRRVLTFRLIWKARWIIRNLKLYRASMHADFCMAYTSQTLYCSC